MDGMLPDWTHSTGIADKDLAYTFQKRFPEYYEAYKEQALEVARITAIEDLNNINRKKDQS